MQTLCWSQYIYIYMTLNRIVDFINVTKINHLNMIIMLFFMVWHYWAKGLTSSPPTHLLCCFRPDLHSESGPQKVGANFEHFWLVDWSQVISKWLEHWPQGLQNWLPKFHGILFFIQPWGPIQGHKVQHLLVNLGQIENIFLLCQTWLLV